MAGTLELSSTVARTIDNINLLINEGQFAKASRLCFKAIKAYVGYNGFYRAKCYCEMRLSRWNSCLETVGWLHLFVEHPSLMVSGNKRMPKRLRQTANAKNAEQHPERTENIRSASQTHIEKGECLWLHFEQAYSYYKLGRFDRALRALKLCSQNERPRELYRSAQSPAASTDSSDMAVEPECHVRLDDTLSPKYRFLLAQIYVRLGHFGRAREVYKSIKNAREDPLVSLNDLSVGLNMLADLDPEAQKNLFVEIDREMDNRLANSEELNYEFFYNWAIAKILEGDYSKAEEYLDLCEERLSSELKEELGENEMLQEQPEFAGIGATRVFLLNKKLSYDLAKRNIDSLKSTFGDSGKIEPGVLMVMLNNWVSLSVIDNVDDLASTVEKLEALLKNGNVVCKFSQRELFDVHQNIISRLLSVGAPEACKKHIMKFIDFFKRHQLIHNGLAAVEYAEGNVDGSISVLKRGLSVNGKNALMMRSLLSVLVEEKRYNSALRTAQAFAEYLMAAGHVVLYWGTLLQCYIHLNQKQEAVAVLSKLLDMQHTPEIAQVLQKGCKFLESENMHKEARDIYYRIYEKDTSNTLAYYGVLFNESFMDSEHQSQLLKPVDLEHPIFNELRFIDAEELEAEGKLQLRMETMADQKMKKPRKRRRHTKVDTTKGAPDPERWLPKYERAAYKKMAKRRKDMTKGNTQGSTQSAGSSKPTSVTISTDNVSSSQRRRRGRKR